MNSENAKSLNSAQPGEVLELPAALTFSTCMDVQHAASRWLKSKSDRPLVFDCNRLETLDSAGALVLHDTERRAHEKQRIVLFENLSSDMQQSLELFRLVGEKVAHEHRDVTFFEYIGNSVFEFFDFLRNSLFLLADVFYWSWVAFFRKKLRRPGEIIHQSILIGVNALPIIGLIAFLIGFILALQSAVQLRQFGANIYVADLVAVAMVSEMGPLITAIMVAGRSGSAIAAELASMVVSEEIDSLRVMGIDPIPYLIVPKLLAILLTLPLLTLFADIIGIFGGMIIGITYLDLDIIPFLNEVVSVLRYKEFLTALVKSISFSVIILLTGTYFGLKVRGGAEGVGKATTASVVFSIFLVIVADSIIGLVFYFGESVM